MQSVPHGMTIANMRPTRSVFQIDHITPDMVYLVDLCNVTDAMSVTNDAEAVVENLYKEFGDKRFIYQDSMGNWDELVHARGVFIDFAPYRKN
jgi:hypothetical protein